MVIRPSIPRSGKRALGNFMRGSNLEQRLGQRPLSRDDNQKFGRVKLRLFAHGSMGKNSQAKELHRRMLISRVPVLRYFGGSGFISGSPLPAPRRMPHAVCERTFKSRERGAGSMVSKPHGVCGPGPGGPVRT